MLAQVLVATFLLCTFSALDGYSPELALVSEPTLVGTPAHYFLPKDLLEKSRYEEAGDISFFVSDPTIVSDHEAHFELLYSHAASAPVVWPISIGVASEPLADDQIREIMTKKSIATYSGNCPCPFDSDRAGGYCGKRSAWCKADGYSPHCFKSDISNEIVAEFRNKKT